MYAIRSYYEQVSNAARHLTAGNSEQAAGMEEVSASMEEMAANIRNNMENARITGET